MIAHKRSKCRQVIFRGVIKCRVLNKYEFNVLCVVCKMSSFSNALSFFHVTLFDILGNTNWNKLQAPEGKLYPWDESSTYIKSPPFFDKMTKELPTEGASVKNASILLNLGDSVTTDHISPAGSIARSSPAAR